MFQLKNVITSVLNYHVDKILLLNINHSVQIVTFCIASNAVNKLPYSYNFISKNIITSPLPYFSVCQNEFVIIIIIDNIIWIINIVLVTGIIYK